MAKLSAESIFPNYTVATQFEDETTISRIAGGKPLMLVVLLVSVFAFDTALAIAVSFLISAWIDVWVTSLPLKKLLGYSFTDQLRDVWKSGLAAVVMAGAVWALGLLPLSLAPLLIMQIMLGGALYLGLSLLLKNESLAYILSLVKRRRAAP